MAFIADKQTTDELNLLAKYQPGSVYNLFNKVKTKGGERLLEEMFRHPLTDAAAINGRVAVFRYFQQGNYQFPIAGPVVATFDNWMDSGAHRTLAGALFSQVRNKLLSVLVHDTRHQEQQTGIHAAAAVLESAGHLADIMDLDAAPVAYRQQLATVKGILNDKRLRPLRTVAATTAFSLQEAAYYDHLLKHTLATAIKTVLTFLYETDVYNTVSTIAREKAFHFATAVTDTAHQHSFAVRNLRHPCLEKAVGNDLVLDQQHNVLFLTGANMAGKSTLMKSIGIATYLAHMGFPVAAADMRFHPRDGLYTSINVADNIEQGYSHFYAEVLRVKRAAELVSAGKHMMVIFDELFKGTNVKDAYEGTLEVTSAFSTHTNCQFIVSTHIIEVGEALLANAHVSFGYMPTVMSGNRPVYTYQLQEGITADRQGMLIIENEDILTLLAAGKTR